ncbi:4-alpha-D-{(1-_4)-alpha-D-glucano}trehalose trehalohydrolase [Trachipleistophora hominis]|uniref:4-alpha-D-((1->4)-alpha-D-glucano)trehalose trehalohydrolase n=1 Tax=Trachipleistophora hominis TaxID=72359 RepID=L7JR19_TRAHO|nr:4-alpha-D-{(1->4)-alpha-D-glucano}trehalose trehalohydrolase [Trachipleistophora hominis]
MISIHQPDDRSYLVLNDVILMSHGRIITSGTMLECKNFLIQNGYKQQENATFSSFAMEVLSDISQRYNENSDEKDLSILANVYRKQFNCEGKYGNFRVRNDFCIELAPSLNDISVLMLRRMKLGLV